MGVLQLIGLQLFWLSFTAIGAAIYKLVRRYRPLSSEIKEHWLRSHFLVKGFVYFAIGFASFGWLVMLACIAQWSITVIVVAYLGALAGALVMLARSLRSSLAGKKALRLPSLAIILVIIVLGIDFCASLRIGGQLFGDTQFEVAQVMFFKQQHLSLADPVFGAAAAPMTVYSFNILHALQATAATLLHASAAWVWVNSYATFRLLLWVGCFALAWEFLPRAVRSSWSYALVVAVPFIYGDTFSNLEIHNRLVIVWSMVFLMGLKWWITANSRLLLIVAAILIAATHPLSASIALAFIVLLAVGLLIAKRSTSAQIIGLWPVVAILLMPVVVFYAYPHSLSVAGFNDAPTNGVAFHLHHIGFMTINAGHFDFTIVSLLGFMMFCAVLYGARYLERASFRTMLAIVGLAGLGAVYSNQLFGLIGIAYLIWHTTHRGLRILLGAVAGFTALTIYNPVFMTVVKGREPLWAIARLQDFNVLALLMPLCGILVVASLLLRLQDRRLLRISVPLLALVVCVWSGSFFNPSVHVTDIASTRLRTNRQSQIQTYTSLATFGSILHGQTVFTDDPDLSPVLPGADGAYVLYLDNEANANPVVHDAQRKQCAARLRSDLSAADLRAAGVQAIVTSTQTGTRFDRLLTDRQDITLLQQTGKYRLFGVSETNKLPVPPSPSCLWVTPPATSAAI